MTRKRKKSTVFPHKSSGGRYQRVTRQEMELDSLDRSQERSKSQIYNKINSKIREIRQDHNYFSPEYSLVLSLRGESTDKLHGI